MVNRRRRNSVDPDTIIEPVLNIDETLMYTYRGDRFYQFGPGHLHGWVESSNIVIFFDNAMVVPFRSGKVWSIDGTFDVCPVGWAQMYTISILVDHHVLPIVYDLLPSKSGNCYLEFLSHLNRLIPGLDPDVVITDFEKAAINAFKTVYPSSRMSGCMFHLGQSIQRRLDSSGMSESYASDRVVRKFVQALKCLAFVPAAQVQQTFTWLRNHDDFPSCLASTYAYFDKTYVSGANGNGPLYPLCLWNNRENVLADIPRTNNGIEG
ncbi:hypothetical protein ECANGB1_531 [Enterospora canceri]|uniref:MULE transposase domain-containing protein n=1 Tax=Enterospora canceri TaxID=1081671 RepID=A0A1Y1S902_9MICR|nr:hypothetical protein ECANGB1_531 [Enterospora canceri]